MSRTQQLSKHQRGAGLIEVLITVLDLAVGLLGISALQLTALKNNQSAMQRSLAVVHSYTIVEAIRAEPGKTNIGCTSPTLVHFPAQCDKLCVTVGSQA